MRNQYYVLMNMTQTWSIQAYRSNNKNKTKNKNNNNITNNNTDKYIFFLQVTKLNINFDFLFGVLPPSTIYWYIYLFLIYANASVCNS